MSPPVLERGSVPGFVCSCACLLSPLLPSTNPWDVTHSHRCITLGPQMIVIRAMQAAPSFVNAAAQWLCKTPVRVPQARPATNALVCFGREQAGCQMQACSGTRELAWLLSLCTKRGTSLLPLLPPLRKVSCHPGGGSSVLCWLLSVSSSL